MPSFSRHWILVAVFIAGVLLRAAYVAQTPHDVRAYDWEGHVGYIHYVADHGTIPPAQAGWEYYQPPLYYFITGGWMAAAQHVGMTEPVILRSIQWFSFLLSCVALAAGIWIGLLLFGRERRTALAILFAGVIAVFPGLVYHASRITNDTLFLTFSFVWCGLLLSWWRDGRARDWHLSCLVLAFALLTKSTALPYFPIAAVCLFLRPRTSWRQRLRLGGIGAGVILLLSGWIFILRFIVERETFIVGNHLNDDLRIRNTAVHLLRFNPFQILAHPYNANWDESMDRQFFWENFFKSSIVGEWNWGPVLEPLVRWLETIGLSAIPLALWGIVRESRKPLRWFSPLLIMSVFLIFSAFSYRVLSPFSPNQDFRFVPVVLVPLIAFILFAIRDAHEPLYRYGCSLMTAGIVASAALVILVPFFVS